MLAPICQYMKPIISAIALLISTVTFGQGIKELQVVVNPTFSTRYLDADKSFKDAFDESEKGMISYDVGALIYPIAKKRFALGTGLIYSRKGYIWAKYTGRDLNGNTFPVKITETINFLEIPIRVTYHLGDDSKAYLVGGLTNDIFLSSKVKVTDGSYQPNEPEKRKYNLGVNIGFGYDFKVSESLTIGVEPNIKLQSMPYLATVTLTEAKRYLYTIGLSVITKFEL